MGSNYNINVSVSQRSGGGGSGGGSGGAAKMSSAREYVNQAREAAGMRDEHDSKGKIDRGTSPTNPTAKLEKSILQLTKEIKDLNNMMRKGAQGGGGGGGGGGGRGGGGGGKPILGDVLRQSSGGVGAAMGAVGTAVAGIPFVGGIIGGALNALGYGWSRMSAAADAGRAARVQQLHTEGISGTRGGGSYFSGSEAGQLAKSRAMASGQFESGTAGYSDVTTKNTTSMHGLGELAAWMVRKTSGKKMNRKDVMPKLTVSNGAEVTEKGFIPGYAHRFGLGAEEMGKQLGVFDAMAGSAKGGANMFAQTAKTVARGGGGVETAKIMSAIGETLEDAVQRGVNSSSMAEDMAKQVTLYKQNTPSGRSDLAISIVKNAQEMSKNASRGKFGGMDELAMMNVSAEMITGKGTEQDKARAKLVASGRLSKESAQALAEGKGISGAEMQYATQSILEAPDSGVLNAYHGKMIKMSGAMNGNKTKEQRAAEFSRFAQGYMGGDYTPTKAEAVFKAGQVQMAPEEMKRLDTERGDLQDQLKRRADLDEKRKKGFQIVSGPDTKLGTQEEIREKMRANKDEHSYWQNIAKEAPESELAAREKKTFAAESSAGASVRTRESATENLLLFNAGISNAIAATDKVNYQFLAMAGTLANTIGPGMLKFATVMADGLGAVDWALQKLSSKTASR